MEKNKTDRIISYALTDLPVRFLIAVTTQTVETMNQIHETTPTAAAAAGRTLTATVMMGSLMKNDTDVITSIVKGDGPIGRITATADNAGHVKCEILHPYTEVLIKEGGKLDVGKVVGNGTLTVIRDIGLKQPYVGQIELISGEIAEDFTYYFAKSEQTPSVVSLGVFVGSGFHVTHAGGFLIQLMPGCPEEVTDYLEKRAPLLPSFTQMLQKGYDEDDIAREIFGTVYPFHKTGELPVEYRCDCSREKIEKTLLALGKQELADIVEDGEPIEVVCHFCNKKYNVTIDEITALLEASGEA